MAFSHIQFVGRLADVLVEAGHQVDMLMLNVDPKFANYSGTSKVKKIIRIDRPESKHNVMDQLLDITDPFLGVQNSLSGFSEFVELEAGFCEDLANNEALMTQLKAENYDVGIAELYGPVQLQFFTTLDSPFGIPVISSYVPNMVWPNINGPNMNFWERAMNLFIDAHDTFNLRDYGQKLMQPIVNKAFGADFPSLREITKNVSLIFTNSNEFFELPHPISNKVQYVGGIVKSTAKPISHARNKIYIRKLCQWSSVAIIWLYDQHQQNE
uniref:glucuronosyltransferase n=1 Tax=Ditylenchus dipsaci TaxID=166011 RepID=A0A915E7S9_9BILA